jgi:hypothetical protein
MTCSFGSKFLNDGHPCPESTVSSILPSNPLLRRRVNRIRPEWRSIACVSGLAGWGGQLSAWMTRAGSLLISNFSRPRAGSLHVKGTHQTAAGESLLRSRWPNMPNIEPPGYGR